MKKRTRSVALRHKQVAAAVAAAFLPWGQAFALPTGEQVAAGQVTVSRPTPQMMQVDQATQKGIVNWQGFSIGASEHVNFTQPSASSITLNRVMGTDPSGIFGRLTANGQIFLTNPAGVLFAPGSAVDVGSLFATTLSIQDQDFLAGRYLFSNSGGAGSVVNQGNINIITANGYAALSGPQVRNDGVIVARTGTVALAAGDQVSLDMVGDRLISISVDQAALNASVINTGTIDADGATVLLTARSANALLDTVINVGGAIRANSLIEHNGEIILDGGSAGAITGTGMLQTSRLTTTSGGNTSLTGLNQVSSFNASSGGAVSLNNAGALDVTGLNAVGSATVTNAGGLTVSGDVTTANGGINLNATSLTNNATISNGGGTPPAANIVLLANSFNLAGGTVDGGAAAVVVRPRTNTNSFGIEDSAQATHLTNADINTLNTTEFIIFGGNLGSFTGNMSIGVDNPVNLGAKNVGFSRNNLAPGSISIGAQGVTTTSNIYLNAGALGAITGTGTVAGNNVALQAGTGIGTSGVRVGTAANTLAASSTSGGVFIAEANDVSLNQIAYTVNATSSTFNNASGTGAYDLTANGAVTVAGPVTTSNGAITLTADSLTNHATITNGGGANTSATIVNADAFNLAAGTIDNGAGVVALRPRTGTNSFGIESAGATTLTNADIASINTSDFLVLGSGTGAIFTGNMTIGANAQVSGGTKNLGFFRTILAPGTISIGANGLTTSGNVIVAAGSGSIVGTGTVGGNQVQLRANTGIGTSPARVGSAANTLAATSNSGGVFVAEADDVTLATVVLNAGPFINSATNTAGAGGAYDLTANGALTVAGPVTTANGTLTLTANSLTNNATISTGGGPTAAVLLNSDRFNLAGGAVNGGGVIAVRPRTASNSFGIEDAAQTTTLTNADINSLNTPNFIVIGSGTASTFTGNMSIGVDNPVIAGAKNISFFRSNLAPGSISIGPNGVVTTSNILVSAGNLGDITGTGIVAGSNVALRAGTGIGVDAATRVGTAATNTLALQSNGGDIFVAEAGDVSLNQLTFTFAGVPPQINTITNTGGTGAYDLTASGALTVAGPVTTSNGPITLAANSLTNHATISNGGGANNSVTILAANAFDLGGGTVNNGAGAVALRPRTASNSFGIEDASQATNVTNADLASINTTGFVVLGSGMGTNFTGNMSVGVDQQVDLGAKDAGFFRTTLAPGSISIGANGLTTSGNVIVSAGGGSIVGTGTVGGNQVQLRANTGIGAPGARVSTAANTLAATSNSGGVFIAEANDVTLDTVVLNTGFINTASNTAGAGGAYDLTANGFVTVAGAVTGTGVSLTSTGGNIALGADVNAGMGTATLISAGDISQSGGTLTAGTLTGSSAGSTSLGTTTLTNLGFFQSTGGFTLADAAGLTVTGGVSDSTGLTSITTDSGDLAVNLPVRGVGVSLRTTTSGNIALGNIVDAGAGTATLISAGNISGMGPHAATLTGSSAGTTTLPATELTNLGAFTSTGGFTLGDLHGLTVTGAVSDSTGLTSITTGPGNLVVNNPVSGVGVSLTTSTSGDIALGANVNAGAGTATLRAGLGGSAGNIIQSAGTLTAGTLTGSSAGTTSLGTTALTNLGAFASTGGFTLSDAGGLTVTGTVGDSTAQTSITTGSGNLAVNNSVYGTGVSLTTTTSGDITVGAGAGVGAGPGGVTLTSAGNITLGANVNAGPNSVTLTSAGNITRSGAGTVFGGDVTLDSATGVGAGTGARVNTAAGTLAARSRTSGGVFISELDGVTLNTLGGVANGAAAAGAYDVFANGLMTVDGSVTTANGGINLNATSLTNNATISNGGGTPPAANIVLLANSFNLAGGTVDGGAAAVVVRPRTNTNSFGIEDSAQATHLTNADINTLNTTEFIIFGGNLGSFTGNMSIGVDNPVNLGAKNVGFSRNNLAPGSISIGAQGVTTTSNIYLNAGALGAITGTGTVAGNNVALQAGTGIGTSGVRVGTAANTLAASSTSGGVFIAEANDVSLNQIAYTVNATPSTFNNASGTGAYDLAANGAVTVAGPVTTSNGAITLSANSLTNHATITNGGSANTSVTILAANAFDLGGGTVNNGAGAVGLRLRTASNSFGIEDASQATNVTNADLASINTTDFVVLGSGIGTNFTGNMSIGVDRQVDGGTKNLGFFRSALAGGATSIGANGLTTSGNVIVNAGGGSMAGTGTVGGNQVQLVASTGIGALGARVGTAANTLAATSNSGGVFVAEADDVTLNTVVLNVGPFINSATNTAAAGGAYDLTANGALTVAGPVTTANGDITLSANSLTNNAAISNGGGANTSVVRLGADSFNLAGGTVNNGAGAIAVRPRTAGNSFGIEDAGQATHLTNADINSLNTTDFTIIGTGVGSIFTGNMSVGVDNSVNVGAKDVAFLRSHLAPGSISIGANGVSTTSTIYVNPGALGAITGTGTVAGNNVVLSAGTGVGTSAARVGTAANTLAASSTSGGVFVAEANDVSLNQVVVKLGTNPPITYNNSGGSGSYDLTANGAVTIDSNITTSNGAITLSANSLTNHATITNAGGANNSVTLLAANAFDLGGGTVNNGAGVVALRPRTGSNSFGIESAGATTLTNSDLASVNTSDFVVLGSGMGTNFIGNMTIGDNAQVSGGTKNLGFFRSALVPGTISIGANGLTTGGNVIVNAGAGAIGGTGTVGGNQVQLRANTGIGTSAARVGTAANTLAATSNSGGVFVAEANDVTLDTVVLTAGPFINSATNFAGSGGAYDLTAFGDVTIAGPVNAGNVTLNAHSISESGSGVIVAGGLNTTSILDTSLVGPNQVSSFTGSSGGDMSLTNMGALTISGNVNAGGTLHLDVAGSLAIVASGSQDTSVTSSGGQNINAQSLSVTAQDGRSASLQNFSGNQAITISGAGAGGGIDVQTLPGGGFAAVGNVNGNQTITLIDADHLNVNGAGGTATLFTANGAQTLSLTGSGANAITVGSAGALGTSNLGGAFVQNVTAGLPGESGSITIVGPATNNAGARLFTNAVTGGTQTVTTSGLIELVGGTAPNRAFSDIFHPGSGAQTISAAGISLTGGPSGSVNNATITSFGGGTSANAGDQFFHVAGGSIILTGGADGLSNRALINALGNQTIDGNPNIAVLGGASGGAPNLGNSALILAGAGRTQTIHAGTIDVIAGPGGIEAGAAITGGTQVITTTGDMHLTGGGSGGTLGGVRIGGPGGAVTGPTNLTLNVGGDLVLTGGAALSNGVGIGSTPVGTALANNITIEAAGDVILNSGANSGARIGSGGATGAETAGGNISISGRSIQLIGPGELAAIRTLDSVVLHADQPGGTISESGNGYVVAGSLTTTSNGSTSLTGPNQVSSFTGSSGGDLSLNNSAALLTLGPVTSLAQTINTTGDAVIGSSGATVGTVLRGTSVNMTVGGNLSLLGGSGYKAKAKIKSTGGMDLSIGGDLRLAGGSGQGARAKLRSADDMYLTVGGAIRLDEGTGENATARIETSSRFDNIYVTFPNLSSGGYFVNGVEGKIKQGQTGFFTGDKAAKLGDTLLVDYGE